MRNKTIVTNFGVYNTF